MQGSYIERETITGVVPVLSSERKYSFMDLFYLQVVLLLRHGATLKGRTWLNF